MTRARLVAVLVLAVALAGLGLLTLVDRSVAEVEPVPAAVEADVTAPERAPAATPARTLTPIPHQMRGVETAAERRLRLLQEIEARMVWKQSRTLGTHNAGSLVDGVRLPREGVHFLTWDAVRWRAPNAEDRRYGSDRLVRLLLGVVAEYRAANPGAPRVMIGDLSRPEGGSFDSRYGIVGEFGAGRGTLGHVSHQNGLDVDVYYPRRDGRERAPDSLGDIDLSLAQDLVDRFVAAGAQFVFVGPRTGLTGPAAVVQPLVRHDDHLHVRLRSP